MSQRTRSRCVREDVGTIYRCYDYGYWQACKHYQRTPEEINCKWCHVLQHGELCLCEEAQREADNFLERKGAQEL